MKYIKKKPTNEPKSLKEHRSTPGANYDDCHKADIRKALLAEQGYICAYCMQRITESTDSNGQPLTTIEHYSAQKSKEGQDLRLSYMNMLGVCRGNDGEPQHLQHCGNRRGNLPLKIDPKHPSCEQFIKYQNDGIIFSKDERVDYELNETLNLNGDVLVKNRRHVILTANLAMQNKYRQKGEKNWSKKDLSIEISRWKSLASGKYEPYCMAAVYYLERKLARLS